MNIYRSGQVVKISGNRLIACYPLDKDRVGTVLHDTVDFAMIQEFDGNLFKVDKGVPSGALAPVWEQELC